MPPLAKGGFMKNKIAIAIILFLILPLTSFPVLAAGPSISLSPSSGIPGTPVTVHGTGFTPTIPCEIIFKGFGAISASITDPNGGFLGSFVVPVSASAGSTQVTVNCQQAQQSASARFMVLALATDTPTPSPTETPTQAATGIPQVTDTSTPVANISPTFPNDAPTQTPPNGTATIVSLQDTPTKAALSASGFEYTPPWFGGRLEMMPPWILIGFAAWLLGLLVLIGIWLFGGGPHIKPAGSSQTSQRNPGRTAWRGTASMLWLLIGLAVGVAVTIFGNGFPGGGYALCGIKMYPDLVIQNVVFTRSDDIKIVIKNQGLCFAPAAPLRMESSFGTSIDRVVGSLSPGESETVTIFVPDSFGAFQSGEYSWTFTIDITKSIKEADEYNNTYAVGP
jgi:hypothetical protein